MMPMKLLTADWCGPCRTVKAFLRQGNYEYVSVMDVDENAHVARSAGIKGVPSLVLGSGEVIYGAQKIINYIKENYDADSNA